MSSASFLQAALHYCGQTRPIFPIDRGTKKPMVPWKLYQESPPTQEQVSTWWTEWPNANIGMATGHLSGLMVIDCDSEDAARRFVEA